MNFSKEFPKTSEDHEIPDTDATNKVALQQVIDSHAVTVNFGTDDENVMTSDDVTISAETSPQHGRNQRDQIADAQHTLMDWQVALPEDNHSGRIIGPVYNLEGRFKIRSRKSSVQFAKTIQLFFDQQKLKDFFRILPSLTKFQLGPFFTERLNTGSPSPNVFIKMPHPCDSVYTKARTHLAADCTEHPLAHGKAEDVAPSLPEVNSLAVMPYKRTQLHLLNQSKEEMSEGAMSSSLQSKPSLNSKSLDASVTEIFTDGVGNHSFREHFDSEKIMDEGKLADDANMVLCAEAHEEVTHAGVQVSHQELHAMEAATSGENQKGAGVMEASEESGQSVETGVMSQDGLQDNAVDHCLGKDQSGKQFILANCISLFQKDNENLLKKAAFGQMIRHKDEESIVEDADEQCEQLQIPFLHVTEQADVTFDSEIFQSMTESDHLGMTCKTSSEETADDTQPFDLIEASANGTLRDGYEVKGEGSQILHGAEGTRAFFSERDENVRPSEKMQACSKHDHHSFVKKSTVIALEHPQIAETAEMQELMTTENSNAVPEESGQSNARTIESYEDKDSSDLLVRAQEDHSGKCHLMQTRTRNDVQPPMEIGMDTSSMHSNVKQEITLCPGNYQTERENEKPKSVKVSIREQDTGTNEKNTVKKNEVEEDTLRNSVDKMTSNNKVMKDTPFSNSTGIHTSASSLESFFEEMQTCQPVPQKVSESIQIQNCLMQKTVTEVQNDNEPDTGSNYTTGGAQKQTDSFPEASYKPHGMNSVPENTIQGLPAISSACTSLSPENSPQTNVVKHEENRDAEFEKNEEVVKPPLSFAPVSTAPSGKVSPFAGSCAQRFVYRPLLACSYSSPMPRTDQTVPGDHDMASSDPVAEGTLYWDHEQQGGFRRIDGCFKWKYVPSAQIDDGDVMQPEEAGATEACGEPCHQLQAGSRPRRIGLSRRQTVKRLHKSAHPPL